LTGGLAFLAAFGWWLRVVCNPSLNGGAKSWIVVLAIPMAIGTLNNGQSNAFMTAGVFAGIAAAATGRWNLAAIAIASACYLKIYPIALGMLLLAMYPRGFGWRFLFVMACGALLPFAFQDPQYVARQYSRWLGNLEGDDRSNWPLIEAYRDVWMLTRVWGPTMSHSLYRVIQVAMGCIIAIVSIRMRSRGDSERDVLNRTLGLGCCWMTAFGPATESPTYILLSPTLAWLLVESWRGSLPRWSRIPLTISFVLFAVTVIAVASPYGRTVLMFGTQPIGTLLIMATLFTTRIDNSAPHKAALPPLKPTRVTLREKAA
jgi:hypothetical protein